MSFVLADRKGWLNKEWGSPFEVVPLNNFANLREGVNIGSADFFMWEHFTSKRYYDNGEIKRIGEIYTPWSSWKIVARDKTDERLSAMFESIDKGISYFRDHQQEAVDYISTELDYSVEDSLAWLSTVRFAQNVKGVDPAVVGKTIDVLGKAGVLDVRGCRSASMIGLAR